MDPGHIPPEQSALARAVRQAARARDAFYERRYEEAVERCQEALAALLPERPAAPAPADPDELAERFLEAYAGLLPLIEAGRVAAVFTFFVRRKARFRYEPGRPLPRREWWEFLQIQRADAAEVLAATRLAVEAVQRAGRRGGTDQG